MVLSQAAAPVRASACYLALSMLLLQRLASVLAHASIPTHAVVACINVSLWVQLVAVLQQQLGRGSCTYDGPWHKHQPWA
jgi:hypothetical protein